MVDDDDDDNDNDDNDSLQCVQNLPADWIPVGCKRENGYAGRFGRQASGNEGRRKAAKLESNPFFGVAE